MTGLQQPGHLALAAHASVSAVSLLENVGDDELHAWDVEGELHGDEDEDEGEHWLIADADSARRALKQWWGDAAEEHRVATSQCIPNLKTGGCMLNPAFTISPGFPQPQTLYEK